MHIFNPMLELTNHFIRFNFKYKIMYSYYLICSYYFTIVTTYIGDNIQFAIIYFNLTTVLTVITIG